MAKLDDTSTSVQTHLQILQGVILRMATNSAQCKAWCITIVSAVLIIVADKGKPDLAFIAFIPAIIFLALDCYYLILEKGFRQSYTSFIKKLHNGTLQSEDLFEVKPEGEHLCDALFSFANWWVYIGLVVLTCVTRYLVLV